MKSMNLEKISTLMDKFEKEFEDLDVQTSVMEGAMSQTTATNIPQDSVEQLMKQVHFLNKRHLVFASSINLVIFV